MGDHNSGGNGSVSWSTDAVRYRKTSPPTSEQKGDGWIQTGIDEDGDLGDLFTVSIQVPAGMSPHEYIEALKDDDGELGIKRHPTDPKRVYFNLRIEKYQPSQLRISWGQSPNMIRPAKRR